MLNIHIGPHKTATTYIQNVMKNSRWAETHTYFDIFQSRKTILAELRALPRGQLPEYASDPGRTYVFSDENMIGGPAGPLNMYPEPTRSLAWTAGNGPTIFFALRRYHEIYVSSWIESLRFTPYYKFREGPRRRGYVEVLAEIERDLDPAGIVLWNYDDFRDNAAAIIEMIAGGGILSLAEVGPGASRETPGREVIDVYERIAPFVGTANQVEVFNALRGLSPGKAGTRYRPFDADDIARLDERFEKDLATLAERYGIWSP